MNDNGTSQFEIVALNERLRWMFAVRLGVIGGLAALWLLAPGPLAASPGLLVWPTLVVIALSAVAYTLVAVRPQDRRLARYTFSVPAIADGGLLGWAMYLAGGVDSQVGYLVMLHVVAVTMLASFRTGLKMALWHSIVAMMVLEAGAVGLLSGGVTADDFDVARFGTYLALIWLTTVATAVFAAVNERELRRRRYDEQVLRRFGAAVHSGRDAAAVVEALIAFAIDELGATGAAVWCQALDSGDGAQTVPLSLRRGEGERTQSLSPQLRPGQDSLVLAASRRGVTVVRPTEPDPWLAAALPGAQRVVAIGFPPGFDVEGALVFESSRWRGDRAKRRIVTAAEQAVAHAVTAVDRAELLARLKAAVLTDGLTGVANRRAFDAFLSRHLSGSGPREPLSVVLADVDHFKRLNDTFGHLAGDDVLREVGATLQAQCRPGDLLARYGGEEFVVVLPATGTAEAVMVAERLREAMHHLIAPVPVTASFGVATSPFHGENAHDLLARADAALYEAKDGGRDRVSTATWGIQDTEDAADAADAVREGQNAQATVLDAR